MSTPEPGLPLRPERVAAIVLAAGQGRRFAEVEPAAGPKLLAQVRGGTMLESTVGTLRAGGAGDVTIVLAHDAPVPLKEMATRLADRVAVNEDPARGMLSSIQAGLLALKGEPGVCLVMPADMPFVRPSSVAHVIGAASGGRTVSPRYRGRGGHPVALSAALRRLVARVQAGESLRPLLYDDDPWLFDVDDAGILHDVDVPADLAD